MRLSQIDATTIRVALKYHRNRLAQIVADKGDAHGGGDVFHDPVFKGLEQDERAAMARIEELEGIIGGAEIVKWTGQTIVVDVGSLVSLDEKGFVTEYLVTDYAAVPHVGRNVISAESNLGKQLIGKRVGDPVYFRVGSETRETKVVKIATVPPPHDDE